MVTEHSSIIMMTGRISLDFPANRKMCDLKWKGLNFTLTVLFGSVDTYLLFVKDLSLTNKKTYSIKDKYARMFNIMKNNIWWSQRK